MTAENARMEARGPPWVKPAPQTDAKELASALDYARYEAVAELAETAASYWRSVTLAALRGERLTVETHCRQLALVTREAFRTVKALGSEAVDTEGASS